MVMNFETILLRMECDLVRFQTCLYLDPRESIQLSKLNKGIHSFLSSDTNYLKIIVTNSWWWKDLERRNPDEMNQWKINFKPNDYQEWKDISNRIRREICKQVYIQELPKNDPKYRQIKVIGRHAYNVTKDWSGFSHGSPILDSDVPVTMSQSVDKARALLQLQGFTKEKGTSRPKSRAMVRNSAALRALHIQNMIRLKRDGSQSVVQSL